MPQVENGPKGLNSILEGAYSSAISQGKSKEIASKIAWAAAKDKYRNKGGKWLTKMYEDLGTIILAIDKVVTKADAPDYEYLLYPIQELSKDVEGLELVREDLQGAPKKGTHKLPEAEVVAKGGPGSGPHPEGNIGNSITVGSKRGTITGIKHGKDQFGQPTYHYVATMHEQIIPQSSTHQTYKPLPQKQEVKINRAYVEKFEKGGPGSGCTGDNCGRPATSTSKEKEQGLSFLHGLRPAIKIGNKVHSGNLHETHADIYNRLIGDSEGYKQSELEERDDIDTGFATADGVWMNRSELMQRFGERTSEGLAEQQQAALKFIKADLAKRREDRLQKGGPGSGRRYEGGPKDVANPSAGNKAFAEPFHSPKHIKQFLGSTNVVLASVNRASLSPEKNALRQQEFEGYLQASKIPYKKGIGVSRSWGNEERYMIHAPEKEQAAKLHDLLSRKYSQDAVIHVRNSHATLQFKDGKVKHANINDIQGGNITDDYTEMDGQRFKIPFKD